MRIITFRRAHDRSSPATPIRLAWLLALGFAACSSDPKASVDANPRIPDAPRSIDAPPPKLIDAAMPDSRADAAIDAMADAWMIDAAPDAPPDAAPDAGGTAAHFLTLTARGEDALDGAVTSEARPLPFAWTLAGATEVAIDEALTATPNCASVTTWFSRASNVTLGTYTILNFPDATDRCLRFTAKGSPDDVRVVALDLLPGINTLTLPQSLPRTGGSVLLQGSVTGAVHLRVTARFTDAMNTTLGTQVRCDSADPTHPFDRQSLPTGSVRCVSTFTAGDFPPMTTRVKFAIEAVDAEGDQWAETNTVAVQP